MLRQLKNKGFASITEVIVTSVIFITAGVGVFAAISSTQPQNADSTQKLKATYAGKSVLDRLRSEVNAAGWDSGNLAVAGSPYTLTESGFAVEYNVIDDPSGARRVDLRVTY